jgi:hypothetical protein
VGKKVLRAGRRGVGSWSATGGVQVDRPENIDKRILDWKRHRVEMAFPGGDGGDPVGGNRNLWVIQSSLASG